MNSSEDKLARLRSFNAQVHRDDPELAQESAELRSSTTLEGRAAPGTPAEGIGLESIILRKTRPVLAIRDNDTVLNFVDQADSVIWSDRLKKAKPFLDKAIRAVGRVDLQGSQLDWVGTGWLVAENILVTN